MLKSAAVRALVMGGAVGALIAFAQFVWADGPTARVPERSFEFEPVLDGAVIEHTFSIHNDGTTSLVIERIESG